MASEEVTVAELESVAVERGAAAAAADVDTVDADQAACVGMAVAGCMSAVTQRHPSAVTGGLVGAGGGDGCAGTVQCDNFGDWVLQKSDQPSGD